MSTNNALQQVLQDRLNKLRSIKDKAAEDQPYPEVLEAASIIEELIEIINAFTRITFPLDLTMAQAELAENPYKDTDVLLHFMGSGASDMVTAGELKHANQLFNRFHSKYATKIKEDGSTNV